MSNHPEKKAAPQPQKQHEQAQPDKQKQHGQPAHKAEPHHQPDSKQHGKS